MNIPHDLDRFNKVMTTLGLVFGKEISEALLDIYTEALKDLDIEQIEMAGGKLINSSSSWPKPVDFRNAIFGDLEQRASSALELALRNNNPWTSVRFTDKALAVAIERTFGTWQNFCHDSENMPEKEWTWKRKQFAAEYKNAAQFNSEPNSPYFIGVFEENNRAQFPEINNGLLVIEEGKPSQRLTLKGTVEEVKA